MTVPIKRLSRACVSLVLLACALPVSAALAQQRREQSTARPAPQRQEPAAAPTTQPSRQSPTPPPAQPSAETSPQAAQVSEDEADLAITANVTASSLRFEAVPNVTVEFPGRPRRDTVWNAERTNLPRPVQPGVTYRDVGVRLKIVSVFADIDRIVAEALGEVPPSDDQAQPNAPPPGATPPASDPTNTDKAAAISDPAATSGASARGGNASRRSNDEAASPLKGSSRAASGEVADRRARNSAPRRARTPSARRQR